MSYVYRILEDITMYPQSTYVDRAERLDFSRPWVENIIKYLEEREQISRKKNSKIEADSLRLTKKGYTALKALKKLSSLVGA